MTVYKIPLTATPQIFTINLANVNYLMQNVWNTVLKCWLISMKYADNDNFLFDSLPLVTGVDLLEQYKYLGIGGKMFVYTEGHPQETPTLENLGTNSNLYFVVDE